MKTPKLTLLPSGRYMDLGRVIGLEVKTGSSGSPEKAAIYIYFDIMPPEVIDCEQDRATAGLQYWAVKINEINNPASITGIGDSFLDRTFPATPFDRVGGGYTEISLNFGKDTHGYIEVTNDEESEDEVIL